MEFPAMIRDALVEALDEYFDSLAHDPDPETIATYVIEQLETIADDIGMDDIIGSLEDEGALDGTLQEVLEAEISSNDEFQCTGEEVASLLDRLCEIEWSAEAGDYLDDEDDETEF